MKAIKIVIGFIVTLLFLQGGVHFSAFAQETQETQVKKYNITFPVADLGNCTNLAECKTFCNSETNKDVCVSFAKKKGFYKEEEKKPDTLVQSAKSELGCNSEATCKTFCEQEGNFEKCSSFAKKHNLGTPQKDPGSKQIIQKAQELLGCNSEATCKTICQQEENQQKCSNFAAQTGLGGGIRKVGPGGCNSEEGCRTYCETNREECNTFINQQKAQRQENIQQHGQRKGPGGCDSQESCKTYCQSNPDECKAFGDTPSGIPNAEREQFCKENPEKCAQRMTEPSSTKREEFCKSNPDKCFNEKNTTQTPNEYCKTNPDKCKTPEARKRLENSLRHDSQTTNRQDQQRTFQLRPPQIPEQRGETRPDLQSSQSHFPPEQKTQVPQQFTKPSEEQQIQQDPTQIQQFNTQPSGEQFSPPPQEVKGIQATRSPFEALLNWIESGKF